MMKVSDPIIFGHAVRAFFADVFAEHGDALKSVGVNPNDGLGALLEAIEALPEAQRGAIRAAIDAAYERGPALAMVDSDRGITNLHVPSDVIIDASMPAAIRASGQMWNADGEQQDTKFVIPDHSYAALYAETVDHCREHGAFDPATMGTTPNVGLMAQAAEEYGSHDKTFEIARRASCGSSSATRRRCWSTRCRGGDIWRMCQTKDAADPGLGPARGRARAGDRMRRRSSGSTRPRPRRAAAREGPPRARRSSTPTACRSRSCDVAAATRFTLERARRGEDTISVTGNVLRDYLTDLFPILELGTSAKMLSIVPLMNGGGLFETGAGGSAPKHVQQFLKENHLRWDSLGEFLALAVSLELLADKDDNPRAKVLAQTLDRATGRCSRRTARRRARRGELDNRGSHFYLALYWAQELAAQRRRPGARRPVRGAGRAPGRRRGEDRRRAERGPGLAGRHRRLLPPRPRADGGRDAPERDVQRGARRRCEV